MANITISDMSDALNASYDQMFMDAMCKPLVFTPKIKGYRTVTKPRYLEIKLPKLSKHYGDDYEYGDSEFIGWLLTFEKVQLFKIGTRKERVPIYEKQKSMGTISFSRYNELKEKNG